MKKTSAMIHVEVLDGSMNPEYIVAVPARYGEMNFCYDRGFYTTIPIEQVLQIPGSFIVRRRNFPNEKIGMK